MPQTSFRSFATTATILIIALLWAAYFVTVPQWHKYQDSKQAQLTAESDNGNLKLALSSLQGFIDSYHQQTKNVSTVNASLPAKSEDMANFTASIGGLAQASGVVLSDFSIEGDSNVLSRFKKTPLENSIQPVAITFTASGSYPSFKDFILRLENHQRLVDINHITLRQDENGQIQYQVSLKTYYQK